MKQQGLARVLAIASTPLALAALVGACSPSEVQDEITNHLHCDRICEWAVGCDVVADTFSECDDACENRADESSVFEAEVELCSECVDDTDELSCGDSRNLCSSECEGVFPMLGMPPPPSS